MAGLSESLVEPNAAALVNLPCEGAGSGQLTHLKSRSKEASSTTMHVVARQLLRFADPQVLDMRGHDGFAETALYFSVVKS